VTCSDVYVTCTRRSLRVAAVMAATHDVDVFRLDTALFRHDGAGMLETITQSELRRHGEISRSPFFRRYSKQHLQRCPPAQLAKLYTQSFCNLNQVNVSHSGDTFGRRIEGSVVSLEPYSNDHVATVARWFAEDEELQDTFGNSGEIADERRAQQQEKASRQKQTFIFSTVESRAGVDSSRRVGKVNLLVPQSSCDPVQGYTEFPRAEIEILVGDPANRRRGFARAAVRLLAQYASFVYGCHHFDAIVEEWNEAAMAFFPAMGFIAASRDEASETTCFQCAGDRFSALLRPATDTDCGVPRLHCSQRFDGSVLQSSITSDSTERSKIIRALKCTSFVSDRVVLVPYQLDHVAKYHASSHWTYFAASTGI